MSQNAFKYHAEVGPGGKVEVNVPIPHGTKVEVLVLAPEKDDFSDLVNAASANLDFWDNPWDDQDWNQTSSKGDCLE
jgi:hypothetical protein